MIPPREWVAARVHRELVALLPSCSSECQARICNRVWAAIAHPLFAVAVAPRMEFWLAQFRASAPGHIAVCRRAWIALPTQPDLDAIARDLDAQHVSNAWRLAIGECVPAMVRAEVEAL